MPSPLPEITLRAPEIVPPTVIPLLSMPDPRPEVSQSGRARPIGPDQVALDQGALRGPYEINPGTSVLPEMRLPSPGSVPPIRLFGASTM